MKILFSACLLVFIAGCNAGHGKVIPPNLQPEKKVLKAFPPNHWPDLATILSKREVPVLCYHHIRTVRAGESETMKSYSVSPASFAEQMKALHDSGYQSILPGDMYEYLVHGAALPAKPFMITFDDTDEEQYSIGYTEMKKYGFKGVYFIMTISNEPAQVHEQNTNKGTGRQRKHHSSTHLGSSYGYKICGCRLGYATRKTTGTIAGDYG